jgi:hypothetical protein
MDTIDLTPAFQWPRNAEVHFDIDLLNKCNLQCPTCFRGVGAEKNAPGVLPLDHFREIVAKARAESYPNICLINWTEAFLLKNLDEYVRVVKEYPDLHCWVSSNLSLPPERYLPSIISALAAGIDILFISVSGWTQETYEINHKAGRVDWIKQNVAGISGASRDGRVKTNVCIRYLQWPYNGGGRLGPTGLRDPHRVRCRSGARRSARTAAEELPGPHSECRGGHCRAGNCCPDERHGLFSRILPVAVASHYSTIDHDPAFVNEALEFRGVSN